MATLFAVPEDPDASDGDAADSSDDPASSVPSWHSPWYFRHVIQHAEVRGFLRGAVFTPGKGPAFINLPREPPLHPDRELALYAVADALHQPGQDYLPAHAAAHCWAEKIPEPCYTPEQWMEWKQQRDIGFGLIPEDLWSNHTPEILLVQRRSAAHLLREAAPHAAAATKLLHEAFGGLDPLEAASLTLPLPLSLKSANFLGEAATHVAAATKFLQEAFGCLDSQRVAFLTLRPPLSLEAMDAERRLVFLASRDFWYEPIPHVRNPVDAAPAA